MRVGTGLALLGMALSFVLSWHLTDSGPFVVFAPVAMSGKWVENFAERWKKGA